MYHGLHIRLGHQKNGTNLYPQILLDAELSHITPSQASLSLSKALRQAISHK